MINRISWIYKEIKAVIQANEWIYYTESQNYNEDIFFFEKFRFL